jgi:pseudouridine-5'-phosphate glycosidase
VESGEQAARLLQIHWQMGAPQGVVLAVPVPGEHGIPLADVEAHIQEAVRTAAQKNLSGAQLTPFLLKHLATASGQRTLHANLALLENNAAMAARISAKLSI